MTKEQKGVKQVPGRRHWIKLWCEKTLYGTVTEKLQPDERWCWVGILALTGLSENQPNLCMKGEVGYTDEQLSMMLSVPLQVWLRAKDVMIRNDMIRLSKTNAIFVVNWSVYQTEYSRQKVYRKGEVPIKQRPEPKGSRYQKELTDLRHKVIAYLNDRTGKKFTASSLEAKKYIHARVSEKATFKDFKAAIDNQASRWLGTENDVYLRPSTLFNSDKFWGYVNSHGTKQWKKIPVGAQGKTVDWDFDEDEKEILPALRFAYREKLEEVMKEEGWQTEDDVDWLTVPTEFDFIRRKVNEFRKLKEAGQHIDIQTTDLEELK